MKVTILTYGSRGDVQPYAALALGLQERGQDVLLAAPQRFSSLAAEHAIPFAPLPGDPEHVSARINDHRGNVLKSVQAIADYVFSIAAPVSQAMQAACEGADLIVHSFLFTAGAHSLARRMRIPDVSIQTFPVFAPTRAFPNVALANTPPGLLSYFTHWLATQIFWHGGNFGFRKLRLSAPGSLDFDLHWPFDARRSPASPLLFAYSPTVLPRPADWTAGNIHITGYFFLDAPNGYRPAPELAAFLDGGEPPVCVTFGSMINREAERVDGILRTALSQAGRRAILLTGWGGRAPAGHSRDLLYLEAAPHDWLLPRCQAVIHHGGAGTTAAGLRAGIPNIVIPHAVDQPFWGKRVAAIGAGPAPLELDRLAPQTLAHALAQAAQPALRSRAQEIGRLIQMEDGVGEAVRLIEAHADNNYEYN